jgi:hypothetical protein
VRKVTEGPLGVGTRDLRSVRKFLGRTVELSSKFVRYEPNRIVDVQVRRFSARRRVVFLRVHTSGYDGHLQGRDAAERHLSSGGATDRCQPQTADGDQPPSPEGAARSSGSYLMAEPSSAPSVGRATEAIP